MFPLRDHIRTGSLPLITLLIITACILVWVFVQGMGQELPLAKSLCLYGLIPGDLLGVVPAGTRIPVSEHLSGTFSVGAGGGVAFWAHVGGYLAGWFMALPLRRRGYTPDFLEPP